MRGSTDEGNTSLEQRDCGDKELRMMIFFSSKKWMRTEPQGQAVEGPLLKLGIQAMMTPGARHWEPFATDKMQEPVECLRLV